MHRKKALSYIEYIFSKDEDVLFFYIGKCLATETISTSVIKMPEDIDWFSVIFGLSMTLKKKLIVVCEDFHILSRYPALIQIAVGKPENILILCLVTKQYLVGCSQQTFFNSLPNLKGMFLNAGILTHDYTSYFKNKNELGDLVSRLSVIKGPLVSTILVEDPKLFNISDCNCNFDEFVAGIETHGSYNVSKSSLN